jgi:hypothetical protein
LIKALKSLWVKSGIALVLGLGVAALYIFSRRTEDMDLVQWYRVLCDGFTIPGLMMILVGLLFWLGNLGAFYALGYLFRYVIKAFAPGAIKIGRYLDYVEEQREKQLKGFGFLFVAGGILMTVAIVFLALFYGVYVE